MLESLGSDHYIIKTQIGMAHVKRRIGTAKITDWDAFRQACDGHPLGAILSIEEWGNMLKERQSEYTKEIDRTEQIPEVDSRLLRLWEARQSLTKRWRRQKFNRKLKLKIAEITQKTEEYAEQLARANWQQFSNSLSGTLSTARTWSILKALLDPTKTKSENNKAIQRLVHQFQGSEYELIERVRHKCFGTVTQQPTRSATRGKKILIWTGL